MLKLIYGRAGSGKTTACFERVKDNTIFIVPEGFSLAMERKIAREFGAGQSGEVDVLSFERLTSQVFARFGPLTLDNLTKCTQQMIMQKVLMKIRNKLNLLETSAQNMDFAGNMLDLFNEFGRYVLTPKDVKKQGDIQENFILKLKLQDISLIYEEYIKEIEKRATDPRLALELLCARIDEVEPFGDTNFILDQFVSFTPQEYAVIERLMKTAKSVACALACDNLSESGGVDVFSESRQTANNLLRMAVDNGVEIEPSLYLKGNKKHENNAEFLHLEQNMTTYSPKKFEDKTQNISVFNANNPYGEVDSCAKKIVQLCREGKCTQRDIAIITPSGETYARLVRQIFPHYGIDIFIDDAQNALKSSFLQGVLAFLNIWVQKFSSPAVLKYLKTAISGCEQDYINELENRVIANGMNSTAWKKELQDTAIMAFDEKFSGRKTAGEIIFALNEYLKGIEIRGQEAAYSILIDSLTQMYGVFADEQMTFEKFYTILKAGIASYDMTGLPQTVEQAHFCEIARYKGHSPKCLFILGAHDGEFPAKHALEGILADSDRIAMQKAGANLAMTAAERQIAEQQTVYNCLTSPTERLFIFYSACDFEGNNVTPSPIIGKIRAMFPSINIEDNIFEKVDDISEIEGMKPTFNQATRRHASGYCGGIWGEVLKWYEHNLPEEYARVERALVYTNLPQNANSAAIAELYNRVKTTSISRVEKFAKCQFEYFMQYGLQATPRKTNKITAPDSGNIMHAVIERFSKIYLINGGFEELERAEVEQAVSEIVAQVIEEKCSESMRENPRFKGFYMKIEQTLKVAIWNILEFYKKSEFKPLEFEGEFSDEIQLDSGAIIKLRGRVDRVDICRTAQGNYINVVDYKSSEKNIDFEEVLVGVQLQLPTYIASICKAYSAKDNVTYFPANMLYYRVDSPIVDAKDGEKSDIWAEIQKKLRMRGMMLEADGAPQIDKMFVYKNNADLEEINKVCNTALDGVRKNLEKIMAGAIAINPHTCDFCEYSAVCQYDKVVK
ncbi:ATP-dependent helicase/deoxyribonuclease subunit B [Clostridia bacterium]|nr:ATP-dependent helicase/deoxyribonuclease subunit B [Clostridia bacterium]